MNEPMDRAGWTERPPVDEVEDFIVESGGAWRAVRLLLDEVALLQAERDFMAAQVSAGYVRRPP